MATMMIVEYCTPTFAAPLNKLPRVSDNSLVIGTELFELDNVTIKEYNLNSFANACKTVNNVNGIYYKYNGKWFTGKDIETFNNLKKAKGIDTIPNDILKINGHDVKEFMNNITMDWYQDGNFSGNSAKNASVEQFVVYFNKPIK